MEKIILNTFFRFIKNHDLVDGLHDIAKIVSIKHKSKIDIDGFLQIAKYNPSRLIDYAIVELIFGDVDDLSQKSIVMKALWCIKILNIPYCSVNMNNNQYKFIQRVLNSFIVDIDKKTLLNYLKNDDDLIILNYM